MTPDESGKLDKILDELAANKVVGKELTEKVQGCHDAAVATGVRLEGFQESLRAGRRKFDDHETRLRAGGERLARAETCLVSLEKDRDEARDDLQTAKTELRSEIKSSARKQGAGGGLAGGGAVALLWEILKAFWKGGTG